MLTSVDIERLLAKINDRLAERNEHGTILLAGGAVMTAVFQSRNATLDIDAVFAPTHVIRDIAKAISEEEGLEADWINDGVKGFIDTTKMGSLPYREFSHLSVNRLDDESLLALKLSSARDNAGKDMDDSIELMSALGISSMDELYAILEDKIPTARLTPKVDYFSQEAFERYQKTRKVFKANDCSDSCDASYQPHGRPIEEVLQKAKEASARQAYADDIRNINHSL
nr:Nucleotidyl transferase of unknown function (DUF2204) [uncultured bacterium]